MKTITLELIRSYNPCTDPAEYGMTEEMSFTPLEFIEIARKKEVSVDDIFWVLFRNDFFSDKELRLFAVWCAREAESWSVSISISRSATRSASASAAMAAAWSASNAAACSTTWSAVRNAQIEKIKEIINNQPTKR